MLADPLCDWVHGTGFDWSPSQRRTRVGAPQLAILRPLVPQRRGQCEHDGTDEKTEQPEQLKAAEAAHEDQNKTESGLFADHHGANDLVSGKEHNKTPQDQTREQHHECGCKPTWVDIELQCALHREHDYVFLLVRAVPAGSVEGPADFLRRRISPSDTLSRSRASCSTERSPACCSAPSMMVCLAFRGSSGFQRYV